MGLAMLSPGSLEIRTLGACDVPSPLNLSSVQGDQIADYITDAHRVRLVAEYLEGHPPAEDLGFEKAGPRARLFFEPGRTRAAFVSCGGLCPGTNTVLRSAVLELVHKYGVRDILGYRYGFHGLNPAFGAPPLAIGVEHVLHIHRQGGSFLGMSRGRERVETMVDTLVRDRVNILFCIGGDGTLRGAHAIHEEVARRGLPIAIVGIPKTIDNDVAWVDKTFGYDTAVEMAKLAIDAAHTEAASALNGVGLVKLMGRDSGFIAAAATLASREVNFCLIPEVEWQLDGPYGLLEALEKRLEARKHAVIVVAEGCGSMLVRGGEVERDASGNVRYAADEADIGPHVRDAIVAHFKHKGIPLTLKYIDPSYMIRGVPANASDSIFCDTLARFAVHAGMAGKTDLVIGRWNGVFTHVPIPLATSRRKQVDTDGTLWLAVTEATGQPVLLPPRRAPSRG
jgi:6-phosphofructokinase 1